MNINPGVSVGSVRFGMTRDEVQRHFGKPDHIAATEDDEIEWEYYSTGLSLYFDAADPRLNSVLIESPAVTMFGEPVIGVSADNFSNLIHTHGASVKISDLSDAEGTFLVVPELGLFANVEDDVVVSIVCEAALR